jgi:voltage-gated potassium channel
MRHRPTFRAIVAIVVITSLAAALIAAVEAKHNEGLNNYWDAFWWVMVTISTVGYGDRVPVTPLGRIIAMFMMFVGVALLSVITATISSIFVTRKIREGKGLQEIKIKDHILLCGWNIQAEQILGTLERSNGHPSLLVLINQMQEEEVTDIISRFSRLSIKFVRGDFTREVILNRANARFAQAAIILPESGAPGGKAGDERTILATLSLKTVNPKIRVYAHITDRENISHLRKARADEVIVSDAYTGFLLANYIVSPGVPQLFEQLLSLNAPQRIVRRMIPDELIGKTYQNLRQTYANVGAGILIGLGQMSEPLNLSELLSSDYSYLDEYIMRKFKEAGRGVGGDEQVRVLVNPPMETVLSKNDFYLAIESSL